MAEISINGKVDKLEISNYNGNSERVFRCHVTSERFPKELNFFREGNNHSYVKREIVYKGECENNLVVSPYIDNSLRNIKNAFIFVRDSFIEVSPIYDLAGIIDKLKSHLSRNRIDYNIPNSVLAKENLNKKDLGSLEKVLSESYGAVPKEIVSVPSKSKNEGIFSLIDRSGKSYIFKFRNKKENRAETLSEIAGSIPDFFPRNYLRKDSRRYTVYMGDGWYGLESFIEGETKGRDLEYFPLIGESIGKLHQEFEHFLRSHPKASKILNQSHSPLSESNLVSLYLDILLNNSDDFLLSELEKLIYEDFSSKARNLRRDLIHRDLNQSNILWVKDKPIIVDLESIGISERINEFAPALLLQGNRNRTNYVPNSMNILSSSYMRLSHDEKSILPDLLKYFLIRYYIIRNIRRGFGELEELDKLKKDLNQINLET